VAARVASSPTASIIDVSDAGLLGLAVASRLPASDRARVFLIQEHTLTALLVRRWAEENGLEDRVAVLQASVDDLELEHVHGTPAMALVAEPWFRQLQGRQLWTLASLWLRFACLRSSGVADENAITSPHRGRIVAVAVQLPQLAASHGLVGPVEGLGGATLEHGPLDLVMMEAHSATEASAFHYPLWQYEHRHLSRPTTTLEITLSSAPSDVGATVQLAMLQPGQVDAVALWVDWEVLASADAVVYGDAQRAPFLKQTLIFLPQEQRRMVAVGDTLSVEVRFDPSVGNFVVSVGEQ